MSNPEGNQPNATQQESTSPAGSETSIEEQLATSEKRRKDTQAGFTKGQQKIKSLEAENAELMKQLEGATTVSLSEEDQSRLDSLKFEDPEAWRKEVNKLEKENLDKSRANLGELTGEARKAAERNFELERRQQVLEEFNVGAETPITDEVIAKDIPPRISNKLAEGTISFEEYLQEVSEYLGKGKVVKNENTLNQPNLNNVGGNHVPGNNKAEESASETYAKTFY